MANYTRDNQTQRAGVPVALASAPVITDGVGYALLMGFVDSDGYLLGTGTTPDAAAAMLGYVSKDYANTASGNASGDISGQLEVAPYYMDNDGSITQGMIGRSYCYRSDNHTVSASDGGGLRPLAGVPIRLGSAADQTAGKVAVMPMMATPYAASPVAAKAMIARGVATNLEAGSFSAGVFTATANGALASQDGLTIAVNDVIVLPAGTLTTLVVSAANSGPYVVTAIGASDAKVTLTRPSWWRHGDGVPLGAEIKVAAGTLFVGTTWRSFVTAAGQVIGTDDPKLYPLKVTQQITLSSGTYTISNVPVFSTSKLGFSSSGAVGGTPAGTTTNFAIKASSGITAGGIGTAAVIVEGQSVAGTKVNTDASVINVTLMNG